MITIDDFKKVELKIGTILKVEQIEGSDKLYKLSIDLGEDTPRQVLSGVKAWYTPEQLLQKQVIVITNLEPRTMMGLESQGMILAADTPDGAVILSPTKPVPTGVKIK